MHWITVLLDCSLAPSVSGWKLEDILSLTPVSLCNAFQKCDTKSLSQSETISKGSPFPQYHSQKNNSARPCAVSEHVVGTSRMSEPSQSVRVRMQSYSLYYRHDTYLSFEICVFCLVFASFCLLPFCLIRSVANDFDFASPVNQPSPNIS